MNRGGVALESGEIRLVPGRRRPDIRTHPSDPLADAHENELYWQGDGEPTDQPMSISLELDATTAERVQRAAERAGVDVVTFLQNFVGRSFTDERLPARSVEDILAPFRNEVERSGVTDEQLDTLFDEARQRRHTDLHRTRE